ncbi:toxic anion resistance protein [Niallia sp. 03133]|uniref:toxic anion resistance protein n=1 Tax=Niallia sp. 03133 TaxID=3458060 RepID=UPI004044B7D7
MSEELNIASTNKNLFDELFFLPLDAVDINEQKEKAKSIRLLDVLSEEEKKRVMELAQNLDPANHRDMISFGAKAQKNLLSFSHAMLLHVQKKDVGEVGDIIGELMGKLYEINPDDLRMEKKSFFTRIFGRVSHSVQEVLSKYQKTGAQIDRISVKLERSKNILLADIHLLEQLYENNKEYFYTLNIYIAAAEWKLEELTNEVIPKMKIEAKYDQDEMKHQEVEDMLEFAERLERRIYDLKISRQITLQTAPQIRLIQNTNKTVIDKIQSSILTTIPLWRNQVGIALTLLRQRHAVETQKKMNMATKEIIQKNEKLIKSNTLDNSHNNDLEDIHLLKQTQLGLISILEETLYMQEDARKKRIQAEQGFVLMENKLKTALMQMKKE